MKSLAQYTNNAYDMSLEGFKENIVDTNGAFATVIALTAQQSGRVILVDDAAGLAFTLPAIGADQIGVNFKFLVNTSISSNSFKVTAAAGDLLAGALPMIDFDTADKITYFAPDQSDDLIFTANGTTTGGKKGSWVLFEATSATQWFVSGFLVGDGTLATPFS